MRVFALAAGLLAVPASAQNLPPIAAARAVPEEALVGEPISFDGSSSFDPDEGPMPLTFAWELASMSIGTGAVVSRAFDAPGAYTATLTVRDGQAQSLASVTVHVLEPPTPTAPTASSPIAIAGRRAWIANPDSSTVTVVDLDALTVIAEHAVPAHPTTLTAIGDRIAVVCRDDDSVALLEEDGSYTTQPVGHRPWGIARDPVRGDLLVTVEGEDTLARGDERLALADGPRAIAISADGARAYVTHFISRGASGTLSVIDLQRFELIAEVALADDPGPDTTTSGRGVPNLLSAIAIEPSGSRVWIGGLKSNSGRGAFVSGEPLTPENRLRGLFAPIGAAALDDRVTQRIDTNDADSVSAIAFDARGRHAYLAHPGAGRVSIYDLSIARQHENRGDGDTPPFAARIDVGHAPRGLALDGTRLLVVNELSRDLHVIDVSDPGLPILVERLDVTEEPLEPQIALGKRMFHRSREPEHSRDNYIACASCHPDGGHDGRTWDFTQFGEGLRNTIDLRGHPQAPFHWSANFDEIQDFENDIVNGFGGTGLAQDGSPPNPPLGAPNAGRSEELDALAAYLRSLYDGPPSPFESDERGRAIFERAGCPECHRPPFLIGDGTLMDVGTILPSSGSRLGESLTGIDTPGLLWLWDSAPYLHDGRAATLREVIELNVGDRHGRTSDLSAEEIDVLVVYLLALDERPFMPSMPDGGMPDAGMGPAPAGCGCSSAPRGSGWAWLVGLFFLRRRR